MVRRKSAAISRRVLRRNDVQEFYSQFVRKDEFPPRIFSVTNLKSLKRLSESRSYQAKFLAKRKSLHKSVFRRHEKPITLKNVGKPCEAQRSKNGRKMQLITFTNATLPFALHKDLVDEYMWFMSYSESSPLEQFLRAGLEHQMLDANIEPSTPSA